MIYILKNNARGSHYDTKLNPYKHRLFITAIVYDKTSNSWRYFLNMKYSKIDAINSFLNSHNRLYKKLHDLSENYF